jgi:hypothetical protein
MRRSSPETSLIVGFADRLQATDYSLQCENLAWLSL